MLNDTGSKRYERKSLGETEASSACPARTGVTQLKSTHQGDVADNGIVKGMLAQGRGANQCDSVPVLQEASPRSAEDVVPTVRLQRELGLRSAQGGSPRRISREWPGLYMQRAGGPCGQRVHGGVVVAPANFQLAQMRSNGGHL